MKKAIVLLVMLAYMPPLFGQVSQSRVNHEKYWYFRHRLKTKFMKIGPEEGESLPAGIRHVDHHPDYGDIRALDFGDGTIYLGWYIGVLATEINLLQSTGQDYTETARELYFALMAFDRLDRNAEILWSNWNEVVPDERNPNNDGLISEAPWNAATYNWTGTAQAPNGFFCRNDAPPHFENRFAPGEYQFMKGGVARLWNPSVPGTNNGETYPYPPYNYRNVLYTHRGAEASQDQIFNLLMGYLLVDQFADNVTYNGVHLGDKAREQAIRIIDHYDGWGAFRNPGRDSPVSSCNGDGCMPFNGGGNSYAFVYPMAVYADYLINGRQFVGGGVQDFYEVTGRNPYWNKFVPIWSSKQAWYLWNWDPSLPNSHVNQHLRIMMAALSNTFKVAGGPQKLYNMGTTSDNIGWEFYYLLNKAIYPNSTQYWDGYSVRGELSGCPCSGPYNLDTINQAYPWNLSNRFVFGYKEEIHHRGDSPFGFRGEYDALDYMLLYNLFAIVYHNYNGASYTNHIDRKLNAGPVYPTGGGFGSLSNPQTLIAFKTLETNMVVNGPVGNAQAGNITLKAGEAITLLPGFHAKAGSGFRAYISNDFDCNSGYFRNAETGNGDSDDSGLIGESYNRRADSIWREGDRQRRELETSPAYLRFMASKTAETADREMTLYPNPAKDEIYLRFDGNMKVDLVRFYDSWGKPVIEFDNWISGQAVNISHLLKGTYHLQVRYLNGEDEHKFKMFVVVKI